MIIYVQICIELKNVWKTILNVENDYLDCGISDNIYFSHVLSV